MVLSKRTVIFILISIAFSNIIGMAIYTYIPPYLDYLENDKSVIQLVVAIFPFTATIFPSLLGKISDRIQNRSIFFITGTIGTFMTLFLLIFTKDLIWIIILLFLYGFFNACFGLIFILYQEIVENNPNYITYFNAMITLGWFGGAQLGGIFIDYYGILNIFFFLMISSIINLFLLIFIKENRNQIIEHYNKKIEIPIQEDINDFDNIKINSISVSIYFALFFRNYGVRPVMSILAILMAFHLTNDTQIGFLIGFNPLLQFFLMILIGRYIKEKNQKIIMILGYILSSITLFGYATATDFIGFLFYQITSSFSYAMFWNATQIYIAKRTTPQNKGKYIGYANSSFFFGSFIGSIFFSSLLSINSDYYIAMWFMIIFPAISALAIYFKFEKQDKSRMPKGV